MITTLEELNNVVNDVVNRIVDISTSRTLSSNYYASYDHVSDLISQEDFLKYFDLITEELRGREEVLDLQTTEDHELDAVYGTDWCPNYEDHADDFVAKPVSQPLSMTRKAEILDNALENIEAALKEMPKDRVTEVAQMFGISTEELAKLGLPAAKEAVAEDIAKQAVQRNYDLPIEFEVLTNNDLSSRQLFATFEAALAAYESFPQPVEKELNCQRYRFQQVQEDIVLLHSNGDGKDRVNNFISSNDPYVLLAAAKAVLVLEPTNKAAWEMLNDMDARVGVTGHRIGEHDLKVGNWRVHIIPPEGEYGMNNALVNDTKKHLVEFYDLRHIHPTFSPQGQFTGARYYADTLLGKDDWSFGQDLSKTGLRLVGDVPAWTVSGQQMKVVLDFVREVTEEKAHPRLADQILNAEQRTENRDAGDSKDRSR